MITIQINNDEKHHLRQLLYTSPYINKKFSLVPEGFSADKVIYCHDTRLNSVKTEDEYKRHVLHFNFEDLYNNPRSQAFSLISFCPDIWTLDYSDFELKEMDL